MENRYFKKCGEYWGDGKKYPNVEWVFVDSTAEGWTCSMIKSLDGMIDTVDVLNYLIDSFGHRDIGIIGRLDFPVTNYYMWSNLNLFYFLFE